MRAIVMIGLIVNAIGAFSQKKLSSYPLTAVFDSTAYPFSYILPSGNDAKIKPSLPKVELKYYSLSRSLKLESLNIEIPVLIGRNSLDQDLVIIDENTNGDLSDDKVHFFTDTLTGPTKGNFKHFKSGIIVNGKTFPVEFDYSIIKPRALNIDNGSSLENKIHFMVRPYQYRHTTIKVNTVEYKVVLFSKNIFDFSRKSTFLVVVPPEINSNAIKSTDRISNRYVQGDIVLLGAEKFQFERISDSGDSLILSQLSSQDDVYGVKVGFLSYNFSGKDILSGDSVSAKNYRGKYTVLDFWGTWCAPCIKILPDLKKIHRSIDPQKVAMIGVCYDNDVKKAALFIREKNIDWTQLFDSQANSVLGKMFEISAYPSFIVIDPAGKIIFKDEGLNGFQRLSALLNEIMHK